jgi:DNA-binding PadR family transcriptional regulator
MSKIGERTRQNAEFVERFLDYNEARTIEDMRHHGLTGISTGSTRQALKYLCQREMLEVKTRGEGMRTANTYRLLPVKEDLR